MKRLLLISILTLSLVCIVASCAREPIAGVESSVSETGQIKRVKITSNECNVRAGVSNDTEVLDSARKNTKLDVINQVGDWYAVQLPNNTVGFVPSNQATPVVPEDQPAANGNGTTANGEEVATPTTTGDTGTKTPNTIANNEENNTNNPPANSGTLTNDEQEMLDLINQARSQNNLSALKIDMDVTNVARVKSQDMIDNNYFSHNSPTYGSPFDMLKQFGITYVKAGENIAGNQTVAAAHEALMNSPGHRKNILSPDYTHIGIGIIDGGQYGKMFTQQFVSKPK